MRNDPDLLNMPTETETEEQPSAERPAKPFTDVALASDEAEESSVYSWHKPEPRPATQQTVPDFYSVNGFEDWLLSVGGLKADDATATATHTLKAAPLSPATLPTKSAPPFPAPSAPSQTVSAGPTKNDRSLEKNNTPKQTARAILRFVSVVLFWGFCIGLLLSSTIFALNTNSQKSYFGYRIYNVRSASMTPNPNGTSPPGGFSTGAMLIVKLCKPSEISVGDIITYNPVPNGGDPYSYLTHRVIEIKTELNGESGTFFVTKGDANSSADPPFEASALIGKKVFSVPELGTFLQMVREHFALAVSTVVCLCGALILFRWYFSRPERDS
ncbi:MAG: signal peptidase I [Clostridium sp.]|jgi:signal peptidase I|nr:signal peptidase I [Clostridium sp.]